MEFRVIGKSLVGKWQGGELLRVEDDGITEAGTASIRKGGEPVELRSAEFLDLGATASAPAAAAPGARLSPSSEPWQNLLQDPAKVLIRSFGSTKTQITDGELVLTPGGVIVTRRLTTDGAIRMVEVFDPESPAQSLRARILGAANGYFAEVQSATSVAIRRILDNKKTTLGTFPIPTPLLPGQEYELELRAVDSTLTIKLNGATLGEVQDESVAAGTFGVEHNNLRKP